MPGGLEIPSIVILLFSGFVVLIVALVVLSAVVERRRRNRLREWAAQNGWNFELKPAVREWARQLPGRNKRGFSLLVSGVVAGRAVAVAEYSYTTESMADSNGSRSTTTHRYLVTAVRLNASYPLISVQPRGPLSTLGRALFGDSAAATGNAPFDKRFRVGTRHPELTRTLIGPTLMAEHLSNRVPQWSIVGADLLTWQSGRIKDPAAIPGLAHALVRVADLLGR